MLVLDPKRFWMLIKTGKGPDSRENFARTKGGERSSPVDLGLQERAPMLRSNEIGTLQKACHLQVWKGLVACRGQGNSSI